MFCFLDTQTFCLGCFVVIDLLGAATHFYGLVKKYCLFLVYYDEYDMFIYWDRLVMTACNAQFNVE